MNGDLSTRRRGALGMAGTPQNDVEAGHRSGFSVPDGESALRRHAHRTEAAPCAGAPNAVHRLDRRRAIEPDDTQIGFVLALVYSIGVVTVLTLSV